MFLVTFGWLHFTLVDVLDILSVAFIIFILFKWIKDSSAVNIFIAIAIILVLRIVVSAIGMKMVTILLDTIIDVGAIALIVIFQPEIRRFLGSIGRTAGNTLEHRSFMDRILNRKEGNRLDAQSINEIAEACIEMSEQRTGALIVILRQNRMQDIVDTGDIVDAKISKRLLMNIFFENSPLHDGAVVIGDNRIMAARCTLPLTERRDIPARFGMRHKSAIGMSEQSDADVLVVSEQTGRISYVHGGEIQEVKNLSGIKLLLGSGALEEEN